MVSRILFTILITAFFLTTTSPAYAVKPSDKPPPSEDVEDAIKQLQAMTRAYHGYKVFRKESGGSGSSGGEADYFIRVLIAFCPEGSFGFGTSYEFCDADVPEAYVLNTGDYYSGTFGEVETFDTNNSAFFDDIVEQLTNGNGADGMSIFGQACSVGSTSCGGGGSSGTEYGFLNQYNPIAPIAGEVDWSGLDIGSISVRINSVYVNYDSNNGSTEYSYDYEVFFETPID